MSTDVVSFGMGTWKAKVIAKRSKGSRTPGRSKGASCQADGIKKSMAKNSRSYKQQPEYRNWCLAMDAINKGAKKL